jgi:hypothetical protein
MFKKAQIQINIIVYIIVIVAVGLTLLLGTEGIQTLKKVENKAEIDSFIVTLDNSIKSQRVKGIGSADPISFSLPPEIKTVCFIDESEQFSIQSSIELTRSREIYEDRNLFFFPSDKFTPSSIKDIKLNDSDNPLCVETVNGKLDLQLTTLDDGTLIEASSLEDKTQDCTIIPGSVVGDPDEKIDLVFLKYGYDDNALFASDVNDYVTNYLLQTEPFFNSSKFNIWMIDNEEPDCSITSYIFCNSLSVNTLASNCPHDYIFVLSNGLRSSIRSSAISNMAKLNTKDNRLVLLHEFGHSFGKLADEYTDRYYDDWFDAKNYHNCDTSSCGSWSDLEGTDCIKGCSTNEFYRSIDTSIMRNYDSSDSYGLLNERLIEEKLREYR